MNNSDETCHCYYDYNKLATLANKYGTPLRINFLDDIKSKILNLKNSFDKAIKNNNYTGNFYTVNANKANYETLGIKTSIEYGDGVECSSYNDLLLTVEIIKKYFKKNEKLLLCNGFKVNEYLNEIIKLHNEGWNILTIVDSLDEYKAYKNANFKTPLEIGLRIHLPALYSEEGECITDDRFGITKEEYDYIINDVKDSKNLTLSTIHFHQRGFDFEKDKFILNIEKAFDLYVNAKQQIPTLVNFDMGGGTPLPESHNFNYDEWADLTIKTIKEICNKNNIENPNLISENGKYNHKDSVVNIYQVVGIKNTDTNYPWYLLNTSILIAIPEYYALGEPMKIEAINLLDNEKIKVRLAGTTCDCDDVYYEKDKGWIELPKINANEKLYVAILGTGSYQESMNGKGGIHHCLLPEEKDIVIYTDVKGNEKEILRSKLQTIKEIKKLTHF